MKSNKSTPNRIAILLYPGVEPMDFQGPCEIFDLWNLETGGPEVVLVAETSAPIPCAYGRSLVPQYEFANCPSFEALVVPGGPGRRQAVRNSNLMTFIKERGRECHHLISVCTGTFLLAEAGLISGKSVTTHWEFLEELAFYSDLHVEGEKRYIRDGDVWTAAGIYSGIDLALAFINSFEGTRAPNGQLRQGEAGIVQMIAQYFPSSERYHPGIHLAKGPDFIQAEFGTSDLKPKLF